MGKMLFTWGLEVDAATLTATSEISSLPVGNLQNKQPSKKFRMADATSHRVLIDLGAGNEIAANTAILIGHDGTVLATSRIKGGATEGSVTGGTPSVDTLDQTVWPTTGKPVVKNWLQYSSLLTWDNDVDYRYWSITTNNISEIGRVHLTRSFIPRFEVSHNINYGFITSNNARRTPGNHRYSDTLGPAARRWILPISAVSENDLWDGYHEFARLLGKSKDLFICIDVNETKRLHFKMMQCEFEEDNMFDGVPMWDEVGQCYRTTITVSELI